jgi:hypothetical protein
MDEIDKTYSNTCCEVQNFIIVVDKKVKLIILKEKRRYFNSKNFEFVFYLTKNPK